MEPAKLTLPDLNNGPDEGALRKDAVAYVTIAFAWSWLMWILVIKLRLQEAFLNIGSAGPAIAAIILSLPHRSDPSRGYIARWACFVALLPLCCIVLSLHYASRDTNRLVSHFDPLLVLPAMLPAWIISGAFSRDIAVIALMRRLVHWPRRWSVIALLSFPTFLLVPAIVVHQLGGRLVRPADNGKLPIVVAEAADPSPTTSFLQPYKKSQVGAASCSIECNTGSRLSCRAYGSGFPGRCGMGRSIISGPFPSP